MFPSFLIYGEKWMFYPWDGFVDKFLYYKTNLESNIYDLNGFLIIEIFFSDVKVCRRLF